MRPEARGSWAASRGALPLDVQHPLEGEEPKATWRQTRSEMPEQEASPV